MSFTAKSRNFNWFRYVDDSALNWAVRADAAWGALAASGLAAFNAADPVWGRQTRRRSIRSATYQDAVTFRTVKLPFGTAAAFAAAPATYTVYDPGLETGIVYSLKRKTAERKPTPAAVRQATEAVAAT
jgi:hypothetical protein